MDSGKFICIPLHLQRLLNASHRGLEVDWKRQPLEVSAQCIFLGKMRDKNSH